MFLDGDVQALCVSKGELEVEDPVRKSGLFGNLSVTSSSLIFSPDVLGLQLCPDGLSALLTTLSPS
jgi:hypothetical protein